MTNAGDGRGQPTTHSGPGPGDFPLGSMESRAAARAMLATRGPSFSDAEADALVVYEGYLRVTARMTPDYHDLQDLQICKLGREVYVAIYGETVPMHLNPAAQRGTAASFAFQIRFHREPLAGEVLHLGDVKALPIYFRFPDPMPEPLPVGMSKLDGLDRKTLVRMWEGSERTTARTMHDMEGRNKE